jgi:CTP-dependent riboflavin kinase
VRYEVKGGRPLKLTGKVVSGARRAAFFTQLDWVQKQCAAKLGFSPYPGTLNIELSPESVIKLRVLEKKAKTEFVPPDPKSCVAKLLPVSLSSIAGAVIFPAEDVRIHGKRIVEMIAPVRLKEVLSIEDGDLVTLTVAPEKES